MTISDDDLERLRAYYRKGIEIAAGEAARIALEKAMAAKQSLPATIDLMVKALQEIKRQLGI